MAALTALAHERGATLVASLHHVEMALQHFPRIVGLRDGRWPLTCRPRRSPRTCLHALYAQHLHELTGPAPASAVGIARRGRLPWSCTAANSRSEL